MHDLLNRLRALVVGSGDVSVHYFVEQEFFLFHGLLLHHRSLFGLLLFLLLRLFLFLLLAGVSFDFLFEGQLNLDLVILFKILRHWHFNDARIVFQIKKQLVQMHIDGLRPRVKQHQILFHLANAANR